MEKKFRNAVILLLVPIAVNLAITVYCFLYRSLPEFKGYFSGTFLSMFFSFIWMFMARRVFRSNAMVLFAVSLGSFPIKLILFALFAFGGLYLFKMNHIFFGISFLAGVFFSLIIEVWFITAINKLHALEKAKKK